MLLGMKKDINKVSFKHTLYSDINIYKSLAFCRFLHLICFFSIKKGLDCQSASTCLTNDSPRAFSMHKLTDQAEVSTSMQLYIYICGGGGGIYFQTFFGLFLYKTWEQYSVSRNTFTSLLIFLPHPWIHKYLLNK